MINQYAEILLAMGIEVTSINLNLDIKHPFPEANINGYIDERALLDTTNTLMFMARAQSNPTTRDLLNKIEMILELT